MARATILMSFVTLAVIFKKYYKTTKNNFVAEVTFKDSGYINLLQVSWHVWMCHQVLIIKIVIKLLNLSHH